MTQRANEAWDALRAWALAAAGIIISDQQMAQLQSFVDILRLWNRRMALVSQTDLAPILEKHVADSIMAVAQCPPAQHIADLGSGGGFPGIPIGILLPRVQVCLMESIGKKVSFLEEARRTCGLSNVTIFEGRIESTSALTEHSGTYDLVVSRALADLPSLFRLSAPLLGESGRLLAMRAAESGAPSGSLVIPYSLPDKSPRELVIVAAQMLRS